MLAGLCGLLALAGAAAAQGAGCLSLSGSTACPGFAAEAVNPSALAATYSFFSTVTDVTSFDAGLLTYANTTFRSLKYNTQLGCTNTSSAYTIQYARTFLCGDFVTRSRQVGCTASSGAMERMTCQATCLQFAVSENLLVADPTACGTVNTVGAARQGNLTYDFTTCTDWTSLISNNTATCVLGQNNEGNCGFGSSVGQLCSFCNPAGRGGSLVDSCCAAANTNLATCGYTLSANQIAASPTPSAVPSSAVAGAGGAAASAGASTTGGGGGGGLSDGAIAGIVIGSIVGGLLLVALALFALARRRRSAGAGATQKGGASGRTGLLSAAAGTSGYGDEKQAAYDKEALAAKQRKLGDADSIPPSPLSSGTFMGYSGPESAASAKSSPSLTAAGALASFGVGAAAREAAGAERPISQETAGTGSSTERNLVGHVKDQYSSADIVPGSEVVAIYAYEPSLPDELRLHPDSVITVRKIYDDGWAVGAQHVGDGTLREGAFPLVVCTVVGADSDRSSVSSSYETSGAAVTASERAAAASSASRLQPSGASASGRSGRTSSIGGTSFESAHSRQPSEAATTPGAGARPAGFLGALFRKGPLPGDA